MIWIALYFTNLFFLSYRNTVVERWQDANEQSQPFNFNLPIYAERITQAYIDSPSPIENRRKLQYNPKVKKSLDIEADQREEFEGSTSTSCSSSGDLWMVFIFKCISLLSL